MKDFNSRVLEEMFSTRNIPYNNFLSVLEDKLNEKIVAITFPQQGLDNIVFFVETNHTHSYAVKVGSNIDNDIAALHLLEKKGSHLAPKTITEFPHHNAICIVSEKVCDTLYAELNKDMQKAILPELIKTIHQLQKITNPQSGAILDCLNGNGTDWKTYLMNKYNGNNTDFDWPEIFNRKGVNKRVVTQAIDNVTTRIKQINTSSPYVLLHTDLNQRNFFVNTQTMTISAIIDWTESIFGDSLFEFARIRMNMFFNQPENMQHFLDLLTLTSQERITEQLYFDIHMLDYVNWYSEAGEPRLAKIIDYLDNLNHGK